MPHKLVIRIITSNLTGRNFQTQVSFLIKRSENILLTRDQRLLKFVCSVEQNLPQRMNKF